MTAEIVSLDQLGIRLPNIALSRTSLAIKEGANEEDLALLEQWLEAVGGSSLFWWGDYLVHLASTRGEEYARAKSASGYAPATLWQAAWVCRRVPPSRRLEALSFGHHMEVASLTPTDQEIWLAKADAEGLTSKQLRAEIRQSKARVVNGADQSPVDQRAARASEGWEMFSVWYQMESPDFSDAQRDEWNVTLRPMVADYLATCTETDLQALLQARAAL